MITADPEVRELIQELLNHHVELSLGHARDYCVTTTQYCRAMERLIAHVSKPVAGFDLVLSHQFFRDCHNHNIDVPSHFRVDEAS